MDLVVTAMDASISMLNYRFCRDKYVSLTAAVMAGGEGIEIISAA